jgi:hypothetical protein
LALHVLVGPHAGLYLNKSVNMLVCRFDWFSSRSPRPLHYFQRMA